ncbi:hypothetical protein BE08_10325 [Sorangium cellulosum]|uniref:Uncharacterized protein n=1 Tax=Sorangium cellulosum TaxID=56 RepID=A0A150PQN6_SORCE|nr:hypothetical protein BE08_10325 [Sorangium cellulosum]
MLGHMNARVHRALRPLVMLAVGPAFCAAVGITMVHAWIDGRRPVRRRERARAALRHERVLARGLAQL